VDYDGEQMRTSRSDDQCNASRGVTHEASPPAPEYASPR
jgi:hypothetical protein